MNYYEHHIGDYERRTAHLTACEDGIYCRLIRLYYMEEAPLPNDMKALQRRVRAHSREEKAAVATILEEFFTLDADANVWRQNRCDEEIARYQDKLQKAKRSANARWNKGKPHSGGNANASPNAMQTDMRTHSGGNAHQTPDTRHQTPYIPTNQPARAHDPDPPPPEQPPPEPADGFAMTADWQPSPQGAAVAKLAGVPVDPDGVGEFVAFWLTRLDERRTQAQWEHALVKSLQGRRARAASQPVASQPRTGRASSDRLPAWRVDEIRRQFEATPTLVPAELLPHIGVDPATRRPFARPAHGLTIIDTTAKEIGHEPASRMG